MKIPKLQTAFQPLVLRSSASGLPLKSEWQLFKEQKDAAEEQEYRADKCAQVKRQTKDEWRKERQAMVQHQQRVARNVVRPAQKTNAAVNAVNQYVREFKYNLQNGRAPRWYHTYPLVALGAATGAGVVSAPVTTAATMAGGYVGDKVVNTGMKLATGKSWAENVHDKTGLDMEPAAMTNPGMWVGGYQIPKYGTNVMRRGVETAMRISPMQDGLLQVWNNGKQILGDKDFKRIRAIGKYIVSGKTTNKGYYNSLRAENPETNYYGGFDWIPENLRGKNDVIDAFLYGKEIDPGFGLYRQATGKDFGTHTDYVARYYPRKAKSIQVYGTSKSDPLSNKIKTNGSRGIESEIETAENVGFDAAGHREILGTNAAGNEYSMEQDIWKFQPKQYMKKWLDNNDVKIPLWKKALMRTGLEATDYVGTPVIVRTPWRSIGTTPQKTILHGDLTAPPSEIHIDMSDLLKKC